MDEIKEFVVKTWFLEKGYGFATEPNDQDRFYVHASSVISGVVRLGSCIRARVVPSPDPGKRLELVDVEVLDAEVVEPVVDADGFEDFVVCFWNAERGIGTARSPHSHSRDGRGLFFGSKGILTLGRESLMAGSRIRGRRVPDPKYPEKDALADIEIYTSA